MTKDQRIERRAQISKELLTFCNKVINHSDIKTCTECFSDLMACMSKVIGSLINETDGSYHEKMMSLNVLFEVAEALITPDKNIRLN